MVINRAISDYASIVNHAVTLSTVKWRLLVIEKGKSVNKYLSVALALSRRIRDSCEL